MSNPKLQASVEGDTAKTVTLREKDVGESARLLRLISDSPPWASLVLSGDEILRYSSVAPFRRDELISRARGVFLARRLRAQHFNRIIFAEPAWDILLLLYLADSSGGRQTIGQLAALVETPLTTVLRWVACLEKEHLVERMDHPTDRRIVFIRLTDEGRKALDAFLGEMPR